MPLSGLIQSRLPKQSISPLEGRCPKGRGVSTSTLEGRSASGGEGSPISNFSLSLTEIKFKTNNYV